MGKKSKRKSNKPPPCCYHGCTKKEFNNCGEHYKVLEDFHIDSMNEFIKTNKKFMTNPTFGNFVIARITEDYLKGKNNDLLKLRLWLLLLIRYVTIPEHEGKDVGPESEIIRIHDKYGRDIQTKRGRINCMAREIPCDCMEAERIAAKSMKKVAICYWCTKEFLKETMLRCKGCNCAQYCSKECSIEAWPTHKESCYNNGISSAPTPEPVASSFGEPSDADVDVDDDVDVDVDAE